MRVQFPFLPNFGRAPAPTRSRLKRIAAFCSLAAVAAIVTVVLFSGSNLLVQTNGGVQTVTATLPAGTIHVNLPVDIQAADAFLQGTVSFEPVGTGAERTRNYQALATTPIEIGSVKVAHAQREFTLSSIASCDEMTVTIGSSSVSIPLSSEPLGQQKAFAFPSVVKSGDFVTITGPMLPQTDTRFSLGTDDAPLVVKSPRQATFAAKHACGPMLYTFSQASWTEVGTMNVAALELARTSDDQIRWAVTGLENAPATAYPITLVFESDGDTKAITIAEGNVANGRAHGVESISANSAMMTASIFGSDKFSLGLNARSPWSARLRSSAPDDQHSEPETFQTPAKHQDAGQNTQSSTTPNACQSQGTPTGCWSTSAANCLSWKDRQTCESYRKADGTFEPCVSTKGADGKYDGCLSTNLPTACSQSTSNPTACTSTAGTNCDQSKIDPTKCQSTTTTGCDQSKIDPRKCTSTAAAGCDQSKIDPTKCTSTANTNCDQSKIDPTKCQSAAGTNCELSASNPWMCMSQQKPTECSQGTPPRCHSTKSPTGGFEPCESYRDASGKYDGCVSQRMPTLCPDLSKMDPKQCTSTASGATCEQSKANPTQCTSTAGGRICDVSKNTPTVCELSKTNPTACQSRTNPTQCASTATTNCDSKVDPTKCQSAAGTNCELSKSNPWMCVSQQRPTECSQGTPPRCHSTKSPTGGFEPCESYKGADGKYDGCVSQRMPKLCPDLSKLDPRQCSSTATGASCESKDNPTQCTSTAGGRVCDVSKTNPTACEQSKTNPTACQSKNTPPQCTSTTGTICDKSKIDPKSCEQSKTNPTACEQSTSSPWWCVSQQKPTECSQGTPPRCHSTQSPTGGFQPCESYKGADGKYDGCISQRMPNLCPDLSKLDPKQCVSKTNPVGCSPK